MTLDATEKKTGIEGIQDAGKTEASDKASSEANAKKGGTGTETKPENTTDPKAAKPTDAVKEAEPEEEKSVAERLWEDAYSFCSWGKKKAKELVGMDDEKPAEKPPEQKPEAQVAANAAPKEGTPDAGDSTKKDVGTVQASAPAEDTRSWWNPSLWYDKGKEYAGKAWEAVTELSSDAYKSVISQEGQPDVKVEAKMVDGKPSYFTAESDLDTKTVGKDGVTQRKTRNGDTITIDRNTKEIISQSADGKDVFIRKDDGTQIYLDKENGVEYERKGDKMYARDKHGNQWEVNNEETKRKIGNTMESVIQRFGPYADKDVDDLPERGTMTWRDGSTARRNRHGESIVRRPNGTLEYRTPEGNLVIDEKTNEVKGIRRRGSDEVEEIKEGTKAWEIAQRFKRYRELGHFKVEGGKVTDDEGVAVTRTPDGTTRVEGKDKDGKDWKVENTTEGKSTITDQQGSVQTFDPNAPEGTPQVTFQTNDGKSVWSYDTTTGSFDTNGVTFNPDGSATTKWDGSTIFSDGSVMLADGSYLFAAGEQAYKEAAQKSTEAITNAGSVAGEISGKVSIGTVEFGDVAKLKGALGDLQNALAMALAAGNFDAAGAIISAQATVESVIGSAEPRAAIAAELRARGIFSGDAIAEAQKGLGGNTVMGAVENEERHVRGYTLSDPRSVEAAMNRDQAKTA